MIKITPRQTNRKTVIVFRLLSSVPPIFCALFVRDLSVVTDYAGIIFFLLTFSFPALIYIYSSREKGTTQETYYKTCGTNNAFAIFVFLFGVAMFAYLMISLTCSLVIE